MSTRKQKRTARTVRTKSAPAAAASARKKGGARAAVGSTRATQLAAVAGASARLPREPKGRRAQFYADPAIDQLWAVVTAITAEVSVAFDRLDTLERVLERDGAATRAAIEAYRPDEAASRERSRRREELIARVFEVLNQYGR